MQYAYNSRLNVHSCGISILNGEKNKNLRSNLNAKHSSLK